MTILTLNALVKYPLRAIQDANQSTYNVYFRDWFLGNYSSETPEQAITLATRDIEEILRTDWI